MKPIIIDPCQEKWGRMSKTKQGRFCKSCEKVVIDFTKFSDQQIIEYFKTHEKGFCGNFYEDQLNRTYIDQTPPSKFSVNWQKYAAMLSTLFLGLGGASAQVKLMPKDSDQCAIRPLEEIRPEVIEENMPDTVFKIRVEIGGHFLHQDENGRLTFKMDGNNIQPLRIIRLGNKKYEVYFSKEVEGKKIYIEFTSDGNYKHYYRAGDAFKILNNKTYHLWLRKKKVIRRRALGWADF